MIGWAKNCYSPIQGPTHMGIDFQFVAYRGPKLSDDEVARIICRAAPSARLFRHATDAIAAVRDLHCVALYEEPGVYEALPLPDGGLAAVPDDAPLAEAVQAAWKRVRAGMAALPHSEEEEDDDDAEEGAGLAVARALSRSSEASFWLIRGDHSGVGGFAHFRAGEQVEPADREQAFVEGEQYVSLPTERWSRALGVRLDPLAAFLGAFPDFGDPPLRRAEDPARPLQFVAGEHEVLLE
jgi:hypothetical protein